MGAVAKKTSVKEKTETSKSNSSTRNPNVQTLMVSIGRQVRKQRTRRGISRKDLSTKTEVSERYLGELERGRANVTIGLLQRVADTLGEPLGTFIPSNSIEPRISPPLAGLLGRMNQGDQARLYRNILRKGKTSKGAIKGVALIGLRGAGKSTLGKKLADVHGVTFLRISDAIQDISGMAIGEIIEMMGQNSYRRLQRQALERIVEGYNHAVIEAGGGIVTARETFDTLLSRYRTVWVKTSPEEHMQRVIDQGDLRPMAGNDLAMEELRLILSERVQFYSQADYILDTSNKTIDESYDELFAMCKDAFRPGGR